MLFRSQIHTTTQSSASLAPSTRQSTSVILSRGTSRPAPCCASTRGSTSTCRGAFLRACALALSRLGPCVARSPRGASAPPTHLSGQSYTASIRSATWSCTRSPRGWRDCARACRALDAHLRPSSCRSSPCEDSIFATFFAPDEGQEERAGKLLFALLQQFVTVGLDGLVLDAHQYLARLDRPTRQLVAPKLHIFVQLLASQLSQQDRAVDGSGGADPDSPDGPGGILLLIVPPHPSFSPRQFEQLAEPLGGFVLSTANFSHIRGQPGPNAPLAWMRDALAALSPKDSNRHKLLATLPLLGWDFTLPDGEPSASIDGEQYLGLLRRHRPPRLDWHAEAAEHVFTYLDEGSSRHSVYYPSLKSLSERLGMLRGLGVGVALYELGTGLDFFWDLL